MADKQDRDETQNQEPLQDQQVEGQAETESQPEASVDHVEPQDEVVVDKPARTGGKLWPVFIGAAGGAVVVGAVWAIMAAVHPSNPLVASVGGHQIYQSTFHNQLESQSGKQTLTQMIEEQLIKDGAQKKNITASKSEIDQQKQAIEAQNNISGDAQLAMFLQQNGLTEAEFNDILKVNVLEQKLSEQGVKVTNKEITDFYNKNKASFTKQGAKTPEPLSKVRSQIVDAIKQSKATPAQQLLASLAKQDKITIYDSKYTDLKNTIENPPTQTGLASTGGQ